MYFKVLMEMGHVGSGKSCDLVRFFKAENAITLLTQLDNHPALKSKNNGTGIKLIESISKEEYDIGMMAERDNPYLARYYQRNDLSEKCIVENYSSKSNSTESIVATTVDLSKSGIAIKYFCKQMSKGSSFLVSIDAMQIVQKKAKVIWSDEYRGSSISGLHWLCKEA